MSPNFSRKGFNMTDKSVQEDDIADAARRSALRQGSTQNHFFGAPTG